MRTRASDHAKHNNNRAEIYDIYHNTNKTHTSLKL